MSVGVLDEQPLTVATSIVVGPVFTPPLVQTVSRSSERGQEPGEIYDLANLDFGSHEPHSIGYML